MKELLEYLGKNTVISLILGLTVMGISESSILEKKIIIKIFQSNISFFSLIVLLLIFEVVVYSEMKERYESFLRILFRKSMLEYTLKKKQFKKGKYEIKGNPRKSYDCLPQKIKVEIDKMDELLSKEKLPKLFDLLIASFNSMIILIYGFFMKNTIILIFGVIMIMYFIRFGIKVYSDINNTILKDYVSLFEGSKQ